MRHYRYLTTTLLLTCGFIDFNTDFRYYEEAKTLPLTGRIKDTALNALGAILKPHLWWGFYVSLQGSLRGYSPY